LGQFYGSLANEARLAVGLDPRGGDADQLQATAVGGRSEDTGGGDGARPLLLNGSGRLNRARARAMTSYPGGGNLLMASCDLDTERPR
jgi:hypothetical protein